MTEMDTATGRSNAKAKVVVVTGASSGAGKAIAMEFAKEGAHLVLAARREEALAETVADCEALGTRAIAVVTDVTKGDEVVHLAQIAAEWGGRIDVWVNNAGILAAGDFDVTPVQVHDQVIRTNLMGYIHGAHAVLPYFKEQKEGVLINNISVGGWFPTPYAVGYSASKYGLRGYAEALRGELYSWPNIHVCDLYPAFLDTPGIQHAANYTGCALKPAPPVYDPARVGRAAVQLANHPQHSKTVGSVSTFLKVANALLPGISRRITAGMITAYFKNAPRIEAGDGNVFTPTAYGSSIYGGWNSTGDKEDRERTLGKVLLVAGLFAGLMLLKKR